MTGSFVDVVESVPSDVGLTAAQNNELLVLARSADRESEKARAGEESHDLGSTMARFLVRFADVVGVAAPKAVADMVAELRQVLDEADARALDTFRRSVESSPDHEG
jgi:RecB family exonuclease